MDKKQLTHKEIYEAVHKGHKDAEPHLIMPKLIEAKLKHWGGEEWTEN